MILLNRNLIFNIQDFAKEYGIHIDLFTAQRIVDQFDQKLSNILTDSCISALMKNSTEIEMNDYNLGKI